MQSRAGAVVKLPRYKRDDKADHADTLRRKAEFQVPKKRRKRFTINERSE
jgi:hypothetical protein